MDRGFEGCFCGNGVFFGFFDELLFNRKIMVDLVVLWEYITFVFEQ